MKLSVDKAGTGLATVDGRVVRPAWSVSIEVEFDPVDPAAALREWAAAAREVRFHLDAAIKADEARRELPVVAGEDRDVKDDTAGPATVAEARRHLPVAAGFGRLDVKFPEEPTPWAVELNKRDPQIRSGLRQWR